jgi:hypothetical protein
MIGSAEYARAQHANSAEAVKSVGENAELFFDMKIPEGFKSVAVDEPGILKWGKGNAEIYLVVGEIFSKSGPVVFEALRKAAQRDKGVEEVKSLKIKGARAALLKEKTPSDLSRLRSWRLLVVTEKQIVNVDFTAPAKDFKTYIPSFDEAVKSFKIKSKS